MVVKKNDLSLGDVQVELIKVPIPTEMMPGQMLIMQTTRLNVPNIFKWIKQTQVKSMDAGEVLTASMYEVHETKFDTLPRKFRDEANYALDLGPRVRKGRQVRALAAGPYSPVPTSDGSSGVWFRK